MRQLWRLGQFFTGGGRHCLGGLAQRQTGERERRLEEIAANHAAEPTTVVRLKADPTAGGRDSAATDLLVVRRRRHLTTARRHDSRRILLKYLVNLFVYALESMLRTRRRVHVALGEAAPHEFAGVGVRDVDNQCTDDDRLEVVRTPAVAVVAPVSISPTGPPITVVLRLESSMRRHVHIGMYVITPQAPRFELRDDRRIGVLADDRTVVGRRLRSHGVGGCGLSDRKGSNLRKIRDAARVVGDLLCESWSGEQRHRRADGNDASDNFHWTLQGLSDRCSPFKEARGTPLWLDCKNLLFLLRECGSP